MSIDSNRILKSFFALCIYSKRIKRCGVGDIFSILYLFLHITYNVLAIYQLIRYDYFEKNAYLNLSHFIDFSKLKNNLTLNSPTSVNYKCGGVFNFRLIILIFSCWWFSLDYSLTIILNMF